MKRLALVIAFALGLNIIASSQTKVVFMPQLPAQAQFAGYYVAKELGFFADQDLDVEIRHISSSASKTSIEYLKDGDVDIICNQLLPAIIERSKGTDIINIMQTSQSGSLLLINHKPISNVRDINGLKVGRFASGYNEISEMFCKDNNIDVQWIPFLSNVSMYVSGALDATLAYSYNEYLGILFATGRINPAQILNFSDYGYDFPEDGLYTTQKFYDNNMIVVHQFRAAVKKGWDYTRKHQDEALDIVMKYVEEEHVSTNRPFQKMMLDDILEHQIRPGKQIVEYKPVSESNFKTILKKLQNIGIISTSIDYKDFVK